MSLARSALRFATITVVATACATWHSLRGETSIDAGQSFLLGGSQNASFSATVRNAGSVPVSVLVEAGGARRPVTVLAPDATVNAVFQRNETAVFSNASAERAVIRVDIRGGAANLGMRYVPVETPRR